MINRTYKKKLDANGQPEMLNGDFVLEVSEEVELPDPVLSPDWNGLTDALWANKQLMGKAIMTANQNAYSTLLKVMTDGESAKGAAEQSWLDMFNLLGVSWTQGEKDTINEYLTTHNFTIRVT